MNPVLVAEIDQVLHGVGLIESSGDLCLCYVHPGWQQQGIGRALLLGMEDQACRWGVHEIRLTSSAGARGFYERHGYVPNGDMRCAFGVLRVSPFRKTLV